MGLNRIEQNMINGLPERLDGIDTQLSDIAVNIKLFGAAVDGITDDTESVIQAIDYAYTNKKNVIIPNNTKYYYNNIQNALSGTISTNNPVTISGIDASGHNYVGGMVFNLTDHSFGIVVSQTPTSVTVEELRLGTNNTFTAGDSFQISLHKVDVSILDNSRFDPYNNKFTGQSKMILNSNNPDQTSANESWCQGQYHPAFIVSNTSNSNMESRASFIARTYKQNKLMNYLQMGINPLNNTSDNKLFDYLFVTGYRDVDESIKSLTAMGFLQPYSDGMYVGIGCRGKSGYAMYVDHVRNEMNKIGFNAKGTQRTKLEFLNDGVEKCSIHHWYTYSGFSGYNSIVVPKTSSFTVDTTLYGDATHTNEGATGTVTMSLPSTTPIGYTQDFVVVAAQSLRVQVLSATFLKEGSTILQSNTIGDYIRVKKVTSDKWCVTDKLGAWT